MPIGTKTNGVAPTVLATTQGNFDVGLRHVLRPIATLATQQITIWTSIER